MSIVTYRYTDLDGVQLVGECQAVETAEGFYVVGLTGPSGSSKTMSPAIHWKPIRAAIQDLIGERALQSYKVA